MDPISSLSREYIFIWVENAYGTETVEVAFIQAVEPEEADWVAADWVNVVPAGADAQILIGPGSTAELSEGTYEAWVRVTTAAEAPVRHSGSIVIM